MKKLQFDHMLALTATITLVSGSLSVYAQQSQTAIEEVLVTGFKASLERSQELKRTNTSISEAVVAEDIGKLPDTSIAESLARLPGLAGERRDGRTSGLSVRGFNENYVSTTMNGREILGIGNNRGVEYDLYPSEIITSAMVYKTPDATLVNQGIGGVVNLSTIRPLDHTPVTTINGTLEQNDLESQNPDFDDQGHRLALSYSDRFADETIGVALAVASMESPSQEEQFAAWGYRDVNIDGQTVKIISGEDSNVRSALMKRDTYSTIVQFKPNDQWDIVVDALHIKFNDEKVFRGLEEGLATNGSNFTATRIENGLVMAGTFDGFRSVIRNDGHIKDATLDTLGINTKYQVVDDWALTLDAAYGESDKDVIDMESYSGVGRAGGVQGAANAHSFTMTSKGAVFSAHPTLATPDYSNPDLIRLAGPQAWGGGAAPAFGGRQDQQDGFVNNPRFEEELATLRLQAEGNVEFSIINGVSFGVNYSDREKSKVNYGTFLTSPEYFAEDGVTIDGGDGPIPAEYIRGTSDLGFIGLGKVIAYDGAQLYKDGFYIRTDAGIFENDRLGDTYVVSEKVTTLFGMANFETGILTGNIGLQILDTDQYATGFNTKTGSDGYTLATPVEEGRNYTNLLPSLNMNFQLTDDQVIRFAAAKTYSRARMDDMKPNDTVNFIFDMAHRISTDPEFSAWDGSSGNAHLKPTEVIQFDLSYEYYFADDGFLSAGYFFKDIQNWIIDKKTITDFSSYIIPGYHDNGLPDGLPSTHGITITQEEAGAGYAAGTELQINCPLHLFSTILEGFGVMASAAFMDGEIDNKGTIEDIPGLSQETYQLTIYFERGGFEARVAGRKRDEYLSESYGKSLSLVPTIDLGATLVDAQLGYNFKDSGVDYLDGLTITLQAQNLTDEPTIATEEGDSRQIRKYQHFGTNYLLGFNYKF